VGLAPTGITPPCHGARGTQSLTQSVATGNLRPKAKSQVDKLRRRDMAKKKGGIKFTILPLTPDLWPALEVCLASPVPVMAAGACIGGSEAPIGRPLAGNREALRQIVKRGSPPGLLAFDGDFPVGWCQLTPRDALPWLDHMWWFARVDAVPVWSISCFFVRSRYRRQGVMTQLIFAALKTAKRARAHGRPWEP